MKKIISGFLFLLSLNYCSRIPAKEEIEYRGRLEKAIVETFPKKVTVVIHPFENLSPKDTNRTYLEDAIPDNIESMLESLRSSLSYIPFDGMPFYVSDELSNLFQTVSTTETNEDGETITNETSNTNESYFDYLTNYLIVVPTQETQYNALTTTNTNYYEITSNITFSNATPVTNISSNEILITKTNEIQTNLVIVNKNLITPTNMLLLLYEEFPDLTNYLSFLPIEIRRATEKDKAQFADYKLKVENISQWRIQQRRKKQEAEKENKGTSSTAESKPKIPDEPFEYVYHVAGNYRTQNNNQLLGPANVTMRMQIFPVYSSGEVWWEDTFEQKPPQLSKILKLEEGLDPNDLESYKALFLRTPFKKPKISPRLQEEFDLYTSFFRDTKPATPTNPLPLRKRPLTVRLSVLESQIPTATLDWLRYFHAIIINRPYSPLRVSTDPAGTLVYLNGVYVGTTPLVYPTAPVGPQRILFLKDGFNKEEIFTEILPNQTNRIVYKLSALNSEGSLKVTSTIPNAEVYVNALYKGKAPLTVSNLSFGTKYRVEVLNPNADLVSNRNSVYMSFTPTEDKPHVDFKAVFKDYETMYKPPAQKALLIATYVSWFSTIAILGGSIYSQYRFQESQNLVNQFGTPNGDAEQAQLDKYTRDRDNFAIASQATLYTAIGAALLSTGIMGWYLYSKQYYLGFDMDLEKKEWYAKFKMKF